LPARLSNNQFKYSSFLLVFILLVLLQGCTSPAYRLHPEFTLRLGAIEKPVLMPLDVKIYEGLPGGMFVLRDDWSTLGEANLKDAVLKTFRDKNCLVKMLDPAATSHEEIESIQSVYRAVNKTIRLQAYGPQSSSQAHQGFRYSIGSVERILYELEADSMIFVCALARVSNRDTRTIVNLAVADSSGTIIWYSVGGSQGKAGLNDSQNTEKLVKDLIGYFPKVDG
jgi:hypothetical protein